MIPPSEWLPRIFGEAKAGEATIGHAMLGQIMALYNTITDTVLDPPAGLPTDCPLWADVLANFTDAAPIAQWARGFCRGHRWLDAVWCNKAAETRCANRRGWVGCWPRVLTVASGHA